MTVKVIVDKPIFYLVLVGEKDFSITLERVKQFEAALDEIESQAVEGEPSVLVTVSTAKNKFCTGFDLKWMKPQAMRGVEVYAAMLNVWSRIATFPMPTLCIINGHAFAGGLILALCHDFRIMVEDKRAKVKLSEIDLGIYLPTAISVLLK